MKKELEQLETAINELHKSNDITRAAYSTLKFALRQVKNCSIPNVSGSLGFNKGYEQGYNDATSEACQEIAKNYQPNDR